MFYKLILLSCTLLQLSTAREVPGTPLPSPPTIPLPRAATVTCNGFSVYSTCSDCSNVLVCMGAVQQRRSCSTLSPSTPYCVNGACSASPSSDVNCAPSGVTCTGVGFYPDARNCQIYHYCEAVNQPSSIYQCPPNYVYNAETHLCRQRFSARDCVTVQCDPRRIFSSYGSSRRYFAFCLFVNNAVTSIQVLRCPDNTNFDGSSCVFRCPGNGNYAHATPTKYYQCYNSGGRLIYRILSCPNGRNFNPTLRICVTPPATTTTATTSTTAASTSSADVTTSIADVTTSSADVTTSSADVTTSSADVTTSSADVTTSSADVTSSSADMTTSSADVTTSSADVTSSSADVTTSSADVTTSSADVTTSSADVTTSSADVTTSSADMTTSSADVTTSSADATTSSTDVTTSSADVTTSSSDVTTSSADVTTSSTDVTSSSADVTVSNEDTNASTAIDPNSQ